MLKFFKVKPLLVKFADGGPKKKKNHQLNISTQWTARRDEVRDRRGHRKLIDEENTSGLRGLQ